MKCLRQTLSISLLFCILLGHSLSSWDPSGSPVGATYSSGDWDHASFACPLPHHHLDDHLLHHRLDVLWQRVDPILPGNVEDGQFLFEFLKEELKHEVQHCTQSLRGLSAEGWADGRVGERLGSLFHPAQVQDTRLLPFRGALSTFRGNRLAPLSPGTVHRRPESRPLPPLAG